MFALFCFFATYTTTAPTTNNTRVRKQSLEERVASLTAYTTDMMSLDHSRAKIEDCAREISLIAEAIHQDIEAFKDVVSDAESVFAAIQRNKQEFAEMLQAVQVTGDSKRSTDYGSGDFETRGYEPESPGAKPAHGATSLAATAQRMQMPHVSSPFAGGSLHRARFL